jgi:hypothetical protein
MLSLKHRNSFKPSCFDCFICSKYCTGIFSPESSGSFYIRLFSYIYIASFAPASSVVQSRQLMLPLSAALASREVLQDRTEWSYTYDDTFATRSRKMHPWCYFYAPYHRPAARLYRYRYGRRRSVGITIVHLCGLLTCCIVLRKIGKEGRLARRVEQLKCCERPNTPCHIW